MSALSAGPLAPGDKIRGSNTSLILSTCRADGVLLKPDRPATPIDSYWSVRAFGAAEPETKGPRGELWSTEVTISGLTWQLVFGTMLEEEFRLEASELAHAAKAWPANYQPTAADADHESLDAVAEPPGSVAFDWHAGPGSARPLGAGAPLVFPAGVDYGAATYYVVAPAAANGWRLFGETSKLIPVSRQRFESVVPLGADGLRIELLGAPGERVSVAAAGPGAAAAASYACEIGTEGRATLRLPAGACA